MHTSQHCEAQSVTVSMPPPLPVQCRCECTAQLTCMWMHLQSGYFSRWEGSSLSSRQRGQALSHKVQVAKQKRAWKGWFLTSYRMSSFLKETRRSWLDSFMPVRSNSCHLNMDCHLLPSRTDLPTGSTLFLRENSNKSGSKLNFLPPKRFWQNGSSYSQGQLNGHMLDSAFPTVSFLCYECFASFVDSAQICAHVQMYRC